jgi:hypothetical protein
MSKKTSTKTTSTKKTAKKTAKAKPTTKADTKPRVAAPPAARDCPKGGDHEWTDEDGEAFCTKCKEPKAVKAKRTKKAAQPAGEKKMSALDAAAKLLQETGEPMNAKAMIEGIAAKGYWTSPGGKTPHATLYSAILREIGTKGKESRFTKTDRGNFAYSG